MSHRKSDFISLERMHVSKFLEAMDGLKALKQEYDALDYGNTLSQEADFVGENAEILKADLVNAIGSIATIDATLISGFHYTNLYKIRE